MSHSCTVPQGGAICPSLSNGEQSGRSSTRAAQQDPEIAEQIVDQATTQACLNHLPMGQVLAAKAAAAAAAVTCGPGRRDTNSKSSKNSNTCHACVAASSLCGCLFTESNALATCSCCYCNCECFDCLRGERQLLALWQQSCGQLPMHQQRHCIFSQQGTLQP